MEMEQKMAILADAAKYDVSCSSSGKGRSAAKAGLGSSSLGGICHSYTADGRCVSLLKVLLSNICIYDCAYCVNRRSSDVPRAAFTPKELAELTIDFYRRNYIEGLFLSSAVTVSPDHTMERMIETLRLLRKVHGFRGYIHAKAIPGADPQMVETAGFFADRMSVNIELPTERSLTSLAPDKKKEAILRPMGQISRSIADWKGERRKSPRAPVYAPAGQSTQLIVGASPEGDGTILNLAQSLYDRMHLKRVYYSAYVPVGSSPKLLPVQTPPLLREHRLYQADWLLRFYGFRADELIAPDQDKLDERLDPKTAWALAHPECFPVEVNRAPYRELLRVPGIGVLSAKRIMVARKIRRLEPEHLKRLGLVLKRARFFLTCNGSSLEPGRFRPARVRELMVASDPLARGIQGRLPL